MFTMFLMMLAILCAQRGSPSETLTGTLADDSVKLTEFKIMVSTNHSVSFLCLPVFNSVPSPELSSASPEQPANFHRVNAIRERGIFKSCW